MSVRGVIFELIFLCEDVFIRVAFMLGMLRGIYTYLLSLPWDCLRGHLWFLIRGFSGDSRDGF
jgi:hypothetical protein